MTSISPTSTGPTAPYKDTSPMETCRHRQPQTRCTLGSFTSSFTQTFTIDSSIHTMWYNIKSNLTDLQEQHVPSKFTTTRFHQPWITSEVKRITRRKQRSYNRSRNKPTTSREHRNTENYKNRQNNSANLPTTHISTT